MLRAADAPTLGTSWAGRASQVWSVSPFAPCAGTCQKHTQEVHSSFVLVWLCIFHLSVLLPTYNVGMISPNDWSVGNWSTISNTCTKVLGFGVGRLKRSHFQRAGSMEWLSFWERTAKCLNRCVAVACVWTSLCLTLSPWATWGPNFTWKHLQLLHSGCSHEKIVMELFAAKAGNKRDIYPREVLMYPLCFISRHSERSDLGRTKNQGKFPLGKDTIHMMLKGHSILSVRVCIHCTATA